MMNVAQVMMVVGLDTTGSHTVSACVAAVVGMVQVSVAHTPPHHHCHVVVHVVHRGQFVHLYASLVGGG